jgi:hypothetical protein
VSHLVCDMLISRLFSIGNLSSLYSAVWPECWSTHEVCDKNWIAAVTYLQIIGELSAVVDERSS